MVFIDETWAKTNITRTHGWCTKGPPLIHPIYKPGHHPDSAFLSAALGGV